jgi:hypothetical protein
VSNPDGDETELLGTMACGSPIDRQAALYWESCRYLSRPFGPVHVIQCIICYTGYLWFLDPGRATTKCLRGWLHLWGVFFVIQNVVLSAQTADVIG